MYWSLEPPIFCKNTVIGFTYLVWISRLLVVLHLWPTSAYLSPLGPLPGLSPTGMTPVLQSSAGAELVLVWQLKLPPPLPVPCLQVPSPHQSTSTLPAHPLPWPQTQQGARRGGWVAQGKRQAEKPPVAGHTGPRTSHSSPGGAWSQRGDVSRKQDEMVVRCGWQTGGAGAPLHIHTHRSQPKTPLRILGVVEVAPLLAAGRAGADWSSSQEGFLLSGQS